MPISGVLPGYPIYLGSKKIVVADLKGLATYTPGGETIKASQFGQGGIDFVEPINKQSITVGGAQFIAALSKSGTYYVTIKLASTTPKDAVASVVITWYVTATGLECGALDLHAEEVRVLFVFV